MTKKSKFGKWGETTKTGRKRKTTEIFTPEWVVNEMCDCLLEENPDAFAPEKTFLEPSCGDGQFVVEIYRRKMDNCKSRQDVETAFRSLWCIELQQDNMDECRRRVVELFTERGYGDLDFESVFKTNFLVGDSLVIQRKWAEEEGLEPVLRKGSKRLSSKAS